MFELSKVIRQHLLALTPYSSARDEYAGKEGIFLDANENPFGAASGKAHNRYPDPYQFDVKQKIAKLKGLTHQQIFLGNGSDEPIDLLIKVVCEPQKDNIVILPPTYGMYQVCADIQNVETIKVPLTADFQLDVVKILAAVTPNTKMIWICSPNNPSGNCIERAAIISLLREFNQGIVVIDEAYIDFADSPSFIGELDNYKNLVVLQTFSKAWGLAGLRLGMAFANPEIIQVLNKIKYPYNINILTQQTLLMALENEELKNEMVLEILQQRTFLETELPKNELIKHIFPSDSNMLLVKFEEPKRVFDALIEKKVIVRDRSKVMLCDGCLRISVGTEVENKALLAALLDI